MIEAIVEQLLLELSLTISPSRVVLNRPRQYHLTPTSIRPRRFDLQSKQLSDQLLRYTSECELSIYAPGERNLDAI